MQHAVAGLSYLRRETGPRFAIAVLKLIAQRGLGT